ncbi:hypothetical protein F8C76_11195 [Flagellimonas olearia]|uniref:Lipoprotein n=1 Tax=Flagellimonas olearia TaxID=552546 RepID=A0A6I1DYL2_9FLAO|nr:hypothetical protein [Allomuricauda olearia]KAB7528422.1 hypothetical protein F8C76_11195 [Allomuricauda olearia]
MRKTIIIISALVLYACDTEQCSSYFIENKLEMNIELTFVGESLQKLMINEGKGVQFGETGCDMGGAPLLYLRVYDSIYVRDASNNILKVYKQETPGRNIYNIDKYWSIKETKHHTEYTYTITNEDIGN